MTREWAIDNRSRRIIYQLIKSCEVNRNRTSSEITWDQYRLYTVIIYLKSITLSLLPTITSPSAMTQVIVVGGGLAGLSAAHTLLERGSNVLLLDKQPSVLMSPGST